MILRGLTVFFRTIIVATSLWNAIEILNTSSTVAMATDIEKLNCMRLTKMQQDSYGSRTFKDQEIITDEDGILSATDFVKFFFSSRSDTEQSAGAAKEDWVAGNLIKSTFFKNVISVVEDNKKAQYNYNLQQRFLYFHQNLSLSLFLSFRNGAGPLK